MRENQNSAPLPDPKSWDYKPPGCLPPKILASLYLLLTICSATCMLTCPPVYTGAASLRGTGTDS